MQRWLILGLIVLLAAAAIAVSESRKVDVPASPAALLYLVADTEHELTRMPVNFTRMSDQEEIRIGNELARMYGSDERRKIQTADTKVEDYLIEVGQRLAANAHRKLPYKFHYLHDMNQINAFALPGGHVYVTEGMLSLMDSEDELAAVMGHEIEHVDHYHCAERVQQEEALRKIPLGGLVAIPIAVFEAGYSKDQELEADRDGTRLAVQAGYSPEGAVRIFEKFGHLYREYQSKPQNPAEEATEVTAGTLEGYFRTHPLTSERLAQIQKLIASENWPTPAERDLAVAYIFLNVKGSRAFAAHRYAEAERLLDRSLKLDSDQLGILSLLARAQLAQANFTGAAGTYRKILESPPVSENPAVAGEPSPETDEHAPGREAQRWEETIDRYAESLAAADRLTAVTEFRQWASGVPGEKAAEIQLDEAGLALLAGDREPATRFEAQMTHGKEWPDQIPQMGWWHYWNGDNFQAYELLWAAYQMHPSPLTRERLAWVALEMHRNVIALDTMNAYRSFSITAATSTEMVVAVTYWRMNQVVVALHNYATAISFHPEWENPTWVSALYSPTVVQAISEMQQEALRRQQQNRQQ